ncbi:zinc-ribbon domain-containing protein [Sporosarcina sp. FA9]|uniref:zinc ribbon domain-containing protein n=1 Tax=Sporosarcina sp. FA9 TaxID=3413030 RepID=UPI003F65A936
MYCSKCGNRLEADALFCNKCGIKIPHPTLDERQNEVTTSFVEEKSPSTRSNQNHSSEQKVTFSGCLKSFIKLLVVLSIGCLIIFITVNMYLSKKESESIVYNISNEMYSDTEKLLNIIDAKFQTFNLSAYVDENEMIQSIDAIEEYGIRYIHANSLTPEENQMLEDIGRAVYYYFQLIELDDSADASQLNFNEVFNDYSGQKRDIYGMYLHLQKELKDKYGFKMNS